MKYILEKTPYSPLIKFENDTLLVAGRSIPEDTANLYGPVIDALEEYAKNPLSLTKIDLYLEYSNSSSNRSLMTILEIFENLYAKGKNVIVNWYYIKGDMEMLTLGEDFKSLIKVPFMLKEIESFS
jgi:hypothetical protein